jgi:hypothetical protein
MKTAGVVFDFYDDPDGRILREAFPSPEELPEIVKTAHILTPEERDVLRDDGFALILQNEGKIFRKFACVDPGNTLLSLLYFEKTGGLLPEDVQAEAYSGIVRRALEFDLIDENGKIKTAEAKNKKDGAPNAMSRTRDSMKQPLVGDEADWAQRTNLVSVRGGADSGRVVPTANQMNMKMAGVIDVTGRDPTPVIAHTKAKIAALDGRYPLDSYADVRAAVHYFTEGWTEFSPEDRREFCKVAAPRAAEIGLEVPELMARYGATEYAPDVDAHISSRLANVKEPRHREIYEVFREKRAELEPETYAALLRQADKVTGLEFEWGGVIADPWYSTFGGASPAEKTAFGWEGGGYTVDAEKLQDAAASGVLKGEFEDDLVKAFEKDPVAIFSSLPDDTKAVIARLASEA